MVRFASSRFEEASLVYGHGTENSFDEACFLILESLHLTAERLEAFWHARLSESEKSAILSLIDKRITTRKPAPYLVNKAYCQGFGFYVDERVIIPRSFIAEILCSEDSPAPPVENVYRILDLCTGSGCLAIIAANLFPEAMVDAVDLSNDALDVAARNIKNYGLEERVTLYKGDLFAPIPQEYRYDLIITNPPYVDDSGMQDLPEEFSAEPTLALYGGMDGLDIVHRILKDCPSYMSKDGQLICELGRCASSLLVSYPDAPFGWINTSASTGEVFFLHRHEIIDLKKAI